MNQQALVRKAFEVFAADATATPLITLRGGNALDDYREPPPFDSASDAISDDYLETYPWGVGYLDPPSWRHYLPHLIEYACRHMQAGNLVVDALLNSLRPPDRDPPRLASLSPNQEKVVTQFLDALAFSEESTHQEFACQVLEEWWVPGAIYRSASK